MAPKNFYVVKRGRQYGIFDNWDDCSAQVLGYPHAVFKGYNIYEEALKAWETWSVETQGRGHVGVYNATNSQFLKQLSAHSQEDGSTLDARKKILLSEEYEEHRAPRYRDAPYFVGS